MDIRNEINSFRSTRKQAANLLASLRKATGGIPRNVVRKTSGIGNTKRRGNVLQFANVNTQVRMRQMMVQRFGKAPAHDDFPEGGLRISGELPNVGSDSLGVSTTAFATSGAWRPGAPGALGDFSYVAVSPTAYDNNAKSGVGLFSNTNGGNMIANTSQYFRYYRFRRLHLVYEGTVPTTQAGSIQFAYDRDVNALESNIQNGVTSQVSAATNVVDRFPFWTASAEVKMIEDMQASRSDKLFRTTTAGTAIVTAGSNNNADIELYFQGGISAIHDVAQTASVQILGRYRWRFVLDLYGLCPTTADNNITLVRCDHCGLSRSLTSEEDRMLRPKVETKKVLSIQDINDEKKRNNFKSVLEPLTPVKLKRDTTMTPCVSPTHEYVKLQRLSGSASTRSQSSKS